MLLSQLGHASQKMGIDHNASYLLKLGLVRVYSNRIVNLFLMIMFFRDEFAFLLQVNEN